MSEIWRNTKGAGNLDYVTCWYNLAAQYISQNTEIQCAFVSNQFHFTRRTGCYSLGRTI